MKKMISITTLALLLAGGLSVGIFASKQSPSVKNVQGESCSYSSVDTTGQVVVQAKDKEGKECDKKKKKCDRKKEKCDRKKKKCDRKEKDKS